MSPSRCLIVLACALALLPAGPAAASPDEPLDAAFTYQGSLRMAGVPADGLFDFQFSLHDAVSGGNVVGVAQEVGDVFVENGIFTVLLDWGPAPFEGAAVWLQVAVRPGAESGIYTVLAPRHPLTAVPYARYASRSPWSGLMGAPDGFSDNVDNDTTYSPGDGLLLEGTTFSANGSYLQRRLQTACDPGSAVRAVDEEGRVACQELWSRAGNAGTTAGTDYLGTSDAVALELKVNGQRALGLEPTASSPNLVGGLSTNAVADGLLGATIGGGGSVLTYCGSGSTPCINTVTGSFGTVSGGYGNTARAGGTVGGGWQNTAGMGSTVSGGEENAADYLYAAIGGGFSNAAGGGYATVGGGYANSAGGLSTVGGGYANGADGDYATVGGGFANVAGGDYATVPGGYFNDASGEYSFAAGRRAHAAGQGTFVWADSTDEDFSSAVQDAFFVRAAGGAVFTVGNTNGLVVQNLPDLTPEDNGDAIEAVARTSRGENYAAVYAYNEGTSPAIYATSAGTYSGYFTGDIFVVGNCTGCTMAYVAVNAGSDTLQIGDLVTADGVKPALSGGSEPVLAVRGAGGAGAGVAGVVSSRAVLVASTRDGVTTTGAEKADGPVAPGDHLFIVVYGMAPVRVDASAGAIAAGQRLTAAASGTARAQRTVSIEGVEVAEAAPAIGTALEPLAAGKGLIWVLVTVH